MAPLHQLVKTFTVRASLKEARHSIECNVVIIAHLTYFCKYSVVIAYRKGLRAEFAAELGFVEDLQMVVAVAAEVLGMVLLVGQEVVFGMAAAEQIAVVEPIVVAAGPVAA